MTLQEILESVKSGSVSVEEAERILKKESYEEMGYAKLDTSRRPWFKSYSLIFQVRFFLKE